MRRQSFIIILAFLIAVTLLTALDYDPDLFYPNTIVTCFKMEATGNFEGIIDFSRQDGVVQTTMPTFNELAKKFNIVDLRQMHQNLKMPEFNEEGRYLQCVYRVILADDKQMDAALAAIEKDPNVLFAEFDAIMRSKLVPNDPLISQQYALGVMKVYDAWDYVTGGDNIMIGISDSGIKWNHPDLMDNIWINQAELPGMTINWAAGTVSGGNGIDDDGNGKIDDVIGWDFYNNDNNPIQTYGSNYHGTHVAGCAGAVFNNAIGVAGTCPDIKIISLKGSSNVNPSSGISYGYEQARYAAENGASVVNASWGGQVSSLNNANLHVNYITALGCLFVAAAGNDNVEHGPSYIDAPADCPNAVCVAATDANDLKVDFSDYGEPIDICAPGQAILSTIINNDSYAAADGTSMASPLVAGIAALVKAINPNLGPLEIKQRLMDTADWIYHLNPNYAPPNTSIYKLGAGRVNAFAATMYDKIPYLVIEDNSIEEITGDGDGIPNPGELIRLNLQLTNLMDPFTGLMWMTAENVTATLRCNMPGVVVVDSVSVFGTLGAGASNWNLTDELTFETVSTLPSEPIPFELHLTANATSQYPYETIRTFNVNLSLVQPNWPLDLNGATQSSACIADIGGGPETEIIFGDQNGNIHVMNSDGTSMANFPYQAAAAIIGSLALADINADGQMEIVANLSNQTIIAVSHTGQLLWTAPAGGILVGNPIIANLNNSGNPEIIAFTQNRFIVVLNSDGGNYPNFPLQIEGAMLASGAVGDLNDDGQLDIVVATLTGNLHAINSANAQSLPGFPVSLGAASRNHPTIANLDGDGYPEILIPTYSNSQLFAINHDGSIMFQKNIDQQVKGGAVVADVNGNGYQEIVLVAYSGDVFVMSSAGINLTGFPVNIGENVESTPVITNFDGSNLCGIIFGDANGKLHSLRSDGTESPNFPYTLSGNIKVSAAVADLDGDGDMDIAFPNDAGFYVLDIKRSAVSYQWPLFMANNSRSGNIYQNTPNQDNTTPELVTLLSGNYPNPFNPETTISYSIKNSAEVSIDIYNLKGQKVRTLVSDKKAAGNHSVVWNGTDDSNKPVSSGVYFYRMQAGVYSSTRKMMLMK
ncbi:MAG: S8 family serine peptidase [Candidatus Cloacimonadaceae bacterium]